MKEWVFEPDQSGELSEYHTVVGLRVECLYKCYCVVL